MQNVPGKSRFIEKHPEIDYTECLELNDRLNVRTWFEIENREWVLCFCADSFDLCSLLWRNHYEKMYFDTEAMAQRFHHIPFSFLSLFLLMFSILFFLVLALRARH